jgi:pimeloyl-ACP methyl ester carboxylesterase
MNARKTEEKLINTEKYKLFVKYIHGNLPAIVFESGGGGTSSQWDSIISNLSTEINNTIVIYDRAGLGKSNLPENSDDIESEIEALNSLLKQLNYSDEIIFAGHSYGALYMQYYTHMHPISVKGLLFIDPSSLYFIESLGGADGFIKRITNKLYSINKETKIHKRFTQLCSTFHQTVSKLAKIDQPDIPSYIITSGIKWLPTDDPNSYKLFQLSHKKLADFYRAKMLESNSNHNIPENDPNIIISTIKKLLEPLN